MALNTCELWSNGIQIASFAKKLQKLAQRLESSPSDLCLWYVWVSLVCSTRFPFYTLTLFWGFKLSPFSKILVLYQHTGHGFWSFDLQYLCPTKSSSFENFWWRHCTWVGPRPLIKNPGYAYGPACSYCRKKQQFFGPPERNFAPS